MVNVFSEKEIDLKNGCKIKSTGLGDRLPGNGGGGINDDWNISDLPIWMDGDAVY